MLSAKLKEKKPTASVRRDGHLILWTSAPDARISTSVMPL
jgi:hypothetical protein